MGQLAQFLVKSFLINGVDGIEGRVHHFPLQYNLLAASSDEHFSILNDDGDGENF